MESPRILIVSPVRNEAAHIERVARAMARQSVTPALWLVVDDGSDDATVTVLRRLETGVSWMRVLERPQQPLTSRDRLAGGAAPRAFNWGLRRAGDLSRFDFIGKLDGDIELPHDYFERLLGCFSSDPALGLAGGNLRELHGGEWKRIRIPPTHVHGALKLYSRACLEAIGGLQPTLGWDSIDQTYARMRGFRAQSFPGIVATHHRHWGSAQGKLRGRARHGTCAWIGQQPLPWAVLRAAKLVLTPPVGLSGAAFLWGYAAAASRGVPRVPDPEFRAFVRRDLWKRTTARPGGKKVDPTAEVRAGSARWTTAASAPDGRGPSIAEEYPWK